jgi:hypothetical protein
VTGGAGGALENKTAGAVCLKSVRQGVVDLKAETAGSGSGSNIEKAYPYKFTKSRNHCLF